MLPCFSCLLNYVTPVCMSLPYFSGAIYATLSHLFWFQDYAIIVLETHLSNQMLCLQCLCPMFREALYFSELVPCDFVNAFLITKE